MVFFYYGAASIEILRSYLPKPVAQIDAVWQSQRNTCFLHMRQKHINLIVKWCKYERNIVLSRKPPSHIYQLCQGRSLRTQLCIHGCGMLGQLLFAGR